MLFVLAVLTTTACKADDGQPKEAARKVKEMEELGDEVGDALHTL